MLRIDANPRFRTVAVGEEVTYSLRSTDISELLIQASDIASIDWEVYRTADRSITVKSLRGAIDLTMSFDNEGQFAVCGGILMNSGDKRFGYDGLGPGFAETEYLQNVQPSESLMWDPVNNERTHVMDPNSALSALARYSIVLDNVGASLAVNQFASPKAMADFKAHQKLQTDLVKSIDALRDRIRATTAFVRIPVHAIHRDDSTGTVSELKLFLAHHPNQGTPRNWILVDWTHPGDPVLDGEYPGSGPTDSDAINDALSAFQNRNQYPTGAITVTVPKNVMGPAPVIKGFGTTGRSFAGTIADFLSSAALITGLIAVVLTIAPIPGSQVAAAALWIGLFSGAVGAAAAGLNIYDRHSRGVADAAQDGLDALTIVGSIFGAGAAWARCANVAFKLQGVVREFVLIGAVTTDAVQGVFIVKDAVVDGQDAVTLLFQIKNDPNTAPRDKIEKLTKLIGRLVVAGLMIYANVKAHGSDTARINEPPPPGPKPPPPPGPNGEIPNGPPSQKLNTLKDPTKTVDLTTDPVQTGHTSTETHTTTVGHAPERETIPGVASRVAAPGEESFSKFNSFNNDGAVPANYSNDPRFQSLASDPAHGNKVSAGSRREAMAGLQAESQGVMAKPIKRGPAAIEFYDGDGHPWDVKTPPSPKSPGNPFTFDPEQVGESLQRQLDKSFPNDKAPNNPEKVRVLLDSAYMTKADHDALWKWLNSHLTPDQLSRIHEINTKP
jgi:hypothetical protein